jgi:hypothetical protein
MRSAPQRGARNPRTLSACAFSDFVIPGVRAQKTCAYPRLMSFHASGVEKSGQSPALSQWEEAGAKRLVRVDYSSFLITPPPLDCNVLSISDGFDGFVTPMRIRPSDTSGS